VVSRVQVGPNSDLRFEAMNQRTPISGQNAGQGILWMLVAMLLFVGMDTIGKVLAQTYPVFEIVWARFLFQLLFMAPVILSGLPNVVVSQSYRLQGLRAIMVVLTNMSMITALRFIPMTEVSAVASASPLIVTALSVVLLGEKVGLRRWLGVVIGFVGVLIVIRPGMGLVHPATAIPLAAALFYAINQVTTRRLGAIDNPMTTVFYTALIGFLATSMTIPFVWTMPEPAGWGLMASMGMCSFLGQYASVRAFQAAPAATVTPFNYTILLWATLSGYIVFDDFPDGWTLLGALVIVGSGLYIFNRSRVASR
jgi:drug/metabolite transporter (DMT)-like permease